MPGQRSKAVTISKFNITVEFLYVTIVVRGCDWQNTNALQREEIFQALTSRMAQGIHSHIETPMREWHLKQTHPDGHSLWV